VQALSISAFNSATHRERKTDDPERATFKRSLPVTATLDAVVEIQKLGLNNDCEW
jgi:hypothetical protein